jgi:hypothetical protein
MSKIASDEAHEGNKMRKLIDYFCRLIVDKGFNKHIIDNDDEFASHKFYNSIKWMAKGKDDLYVPEYIDVLRVSFTFMFSRGKFSDLVALLSGRNFEARTYEAEIVAKSFEMLGNGLMAFSNQTNFQRFLMLVKSTGLISAKLISSKNSLNFSYALYLKLRGEGMAETEVQHYVKRWLILSLLLARYSGSAESMIDEDIKQINERGVKDYLEDIERSNLGEGFWEFKIVSDLETTSVNNNAYNVYLATQCYNNAEAFLSKSMKISSLVEQRGDIHHIFPKQYLRDHNYELKQYNQVANFVYTEQSTNIKIGKLPPVEYCDKVKEQINTNVIDVSTIDSEDLMVRNFEMNDIPQYVMTATYDNYEKFLSDRRKLMAKKIKTFYKNL